MKQITKHVLWTLVCLILVMAFAPPASAQQPRRLEVFVGYSHLLNERVTNADVATVNGLTPAQLRMILGADITTNEGRAGLNGLHTSVTGYVTERIGFTGDFSANLKTEDETLFGLPGSARMRAYQFLGGPQVKFFNRSRVTPFVRTLFGAARLNGTYQNPVATLVDNNTAFAMTLGGGVDVRVGQRMDLRIVQIDYNSVSLKSRSLADSTGVPFQLNDVRRQNVRLSFGLVLR